MCRLSRSAQYCRNWVISLQGVPGSSTACSWTARPQPQNAPQSVLHQSTKLASRYTSANVSSFRLENPSFWASSICSIAAHQIQGLAKQCWTAARSQAASESTPHRSHPCACRPRPPPTPRTAAFQRTWAPTGVQQPTVSEGS